MIQYQERSPNYKFAEKKAQQVLDDNFINDPPVRPHKLVKNYGLEIIYADFGAKHSNVAGFLDIEKAKIYVNEKDSINRQTFTIAHELGHWLLHKEMITKDINNYSVLLRKPLGSQENDPIEQEANCFAANLLVPKDFLSKYRDRVDIKTLAKIFVVSRDVMGFRLQR